MPPEPTPSGEPKRRGVGMRAGLNIERIIDAARALDPDTLTMQALADHLGVDRKALNHHVSGREALLALVAIDAFSAEFCAVEIAGHANWQDACRSYARGFTESAISTGVLAERIRLSDAYLTKILEPTEAVLQKMVLAGFDDESAMRSLSLLTNICLAYARDTVGEIRSGTSPRPVILRAALEQHESGTFETLERIAGLPTTTYDDRQLELSIEVFVAGTEALLRQRGERTSSGSVPERHLQPDDQ